MTSRAKVLSIAICVHKGERKQSVHEAELRENFGMIGDGHAGSERQVSLLPYESFAKISQPGLPLRPGDFAENITTEGFDLAQACVGKHLRIGNAVELSITHIGKECHEGCHIRELAGDCIMPREGVFARVIRGGIIRQGDPVVWLRS